MTYSMRLAETICACAFSAMLIVVWFLWPPAWIVLMSLGFAGVTTRVAVLHVLHQRGEWP
jgi:hypothetical protein